MSPRAPSSSARAWEAADLILPGTPVTFQRFTRRLWGWVGSFPQTSLFRSWGPRLVPGLWLTGDSILPCQLIPAVALGGMRTARSVLGELGIQDGYASRSEGGVSRSLVEHG